MRFLLGILCLCYEVVCISAVAKPSNSTGVAVANASKPSKHGRLSDRHFIYGTVAAGLGQMILADAASVPLIGGGLVSGNITPSMSISIGYQGRIANNFAIALDISGRWLFYDYSTLSQSAMSFSNAQWLAMQVKPTLLLNDGKFGIYALLGAGVAFTDMHIRSTSISQSMVGVMFLYGAGVYMNLYHGVDIFLNATASLPLDRHVVNSIDVNLHGYLIEFGFRFHT